MTVDNFRQGSEGVRVFLMDQNRFFRQGLRVALARQENMDIVGEAAIEEEAYELIRILLPEVVLMGVNPPDFSGMQLTRRIVKALPATSVVILTSNLDDDELVQVITAGAATYSSKDVEAADLAVIIKRVAGGELPVTETLIDRPQVLERVLRHFQDLLVKGRVVETANSPITDREAEVLTLVACGYGNKQIAHSFGISEQTIKNHMASILRKMAASDRTHAVVKAMQYGWIVTSSNGRKHNGGNHESEALAQGVRPEGS